MITEQLNPNRRGRPEKTVEALRASGSWREKGRKKEAMADKRPKAWGRKLAPRNRISASKAIMLIPGFDPHRDAEGCWFDGGTALTAVKWIETHVTHVKGRLGGKSYCLTPLEKGIVCNLFGWKRADGSRRFQKALIYVARKWGKTLFAAAVALYMLLEDEEVGDEWEYSEEGVEAYCAAAAREQAKILWNVAKRIIQNDEVLSERCRLYQSSVARIDATGEQDGSYFQSISAESNTAHGFNPQVYVLDELHVQPDADLLDVLETGMGSRTQPLALLITTADFERESVCNEEYAYAKGVRDGTIDDPYYLPVICEAGLEDDWTAEETWIKANPKYPETPTRAYLEKACKKAQSSARFLNTFKRLHLNLRTQSDVQWFDLAVWDQMGEAVDPASLVGRPCYGGLDMSSVSDLTAFVLIFPDDGNAVLPWCWVPRDTVNRRDEKNLLPSYSAWERDGHLNVCPGGWVDQDIVFDQIIQCAELYDMKQVAVDRWNSLKIMTELGKQDIEVVQFGQGYQSMSGPSKELERLCLAGDMRHGGHPVMRWCAGNVMVQTDGSPAENIKPVKAKTKDKARRQDDNKIDLIVALIMSIGLMMVHTEEPPSVYTSTRGLISL